MRQKTDFDIGAIDERTVRGHHLLTLSYYANLWDTSGHNNIFARSMLVSAVKKSLGIKSREYGERMLEFMCDYFDFLTKNPEVTFAAVCGIDTLCDAKGEGTYLCGRRNPGCSIDSSGQDGFCIAELELSPGQPMTLSQLQESVRAYHQKTGDVNITRKFARYKLKELFG